MSKPDMTPISRFPDLEKPGRGRLNQLLRLLILTTRGDILTRGATYLKRLALGTAGQILRSDGTDIAWESPGIADNKVLEVDAAAGAPADDEYARFTAGGIEGRTVAEVKSDLAIDHGADLAGLGDDDHAQYIKDTEFTAANDTLVGTGSGTFAKKTPAEVLAILSGDAGAAFSWNDKVLTALAGILATAETELTIDTDGEITVTQIRHKVDTFEDAASDDLSTINGGTTVNLIILRAEADARTVVLKHGTGNIWLQGKADVSLDDLEDGILLVWDSTNSKWFDIAAAGGGLAEIVEDTTPQLGGDLDLNGNAIDFPTTADIDDCLDEDDMASDSAVKLATQQSIKAYADTKSSVTTATMTVYVDGDASGAADGTSWTDAFTTIQAAWDSLPDIIAHAVTINCREATNPYRETVNIDSKYVVSSVTIRGEYYWKGDCEANAGGAGEITDTGAFGDVAVGDKVFILDLNGADSRAQDYEVCTVDSVANAPNRIGTDGSKTPSTGWKYIIVRTEISGSDDGTDGGTARDQLFYLTSIDNITIKGFYGTFADDTPLRADNCRQIFYEGIILKDCDNSIFQESMSSVDASYFVQEDCGGYATYTRINSKGRFTYCALDGATAGAYVGYVGYAIFDYCYVATGTYGVRLEHFSGGVCIRSTIAVGVGTGFHVRHNSCILENMMTNSATTPEDPAVTSEGAFID